MAEEPRSTPSRRDVAIVRVRRLSWAVAAGTVGLASALSVVAANAFKGHARHTADAAPPATTTASATPAGRRVRVPGPQYVPAIVGGDQPLQPPAAPPAQAPAPTPAPATPAPAPSPAPAPAPAPQTSGGS